MLFWWQYPKWIDKDDFFLIFRVGLMSAGIYNEKNAIIYDLGSVLCAGWMLGQI